MHSTRKLKSYLMKEAILGPIRNYMPKMSQFQHKDICKKILSASNDTHLSITIFSLQHLIPLQLFLLSLPSYRPLLLSLMSYCHHQKPNERPLIFHQSFH